MNKVRDTKRRSRINYTISPRILKTVLLSCSFNVLVRTNSQPTLITILYGFFIQLISVVFVVFDGALIYTWLSSQWPEQILLCDQVQEKWFISSFWTRLKQEKGIVLFTMNRTFLLQGYFGSWESIRLI